MAVGLGVLLAGCGGSGHVPGAATGPAGGAGQVVSVTQGTITETVAIDASVVASPALAVTASAGGVVALPAALRVGADVVKGNPLLSVGGHALEAPVEGTVAAVEVTDGQTVPAGLPLVVIRYVGFGLAGTVPPEDAYRILSGNPLSAKGQIRNGPGPFACPVLQQASAGQGGQAAPGGGASTPPSQSGSPAVTVGSNLVCAIPTTVRAYAGLPATLAVNSGQVTGALVLPVSSVAGTAQSGAVEVVSPGPRRVVQVKLGVTDGAVVQILAGLHAGEKVSAIAPNLTATAGS